MKTHRIFGIAVPGPLLAWVAMVALTLLSITAAGQSHHGASRMLMTWLVAFIAWYKSRMLVRHYLESRLAGPVFDRVVRWFALVAPTVLAVSAWREAGDLPGLLHGLLVGLF